MVGLGTIGEKLREIRNQRNLSLRQAAKQIGISHTYLDTLEKERDPRTGEPVHPSIQVLERISKGYRIPLSEFLMMMGYDEQRLGVRREVETTERVSHDTTDAGVHIIQEEDEAALNDVEIIARSIKSLPLEDRKILLYLIRRLANKSANQN